MLLVFLLNLGSVTFLEKNYGRLYKKNKLKRKRKTRVHFSFSSKMVADRMILNRPSNLVEIQFNVVNVEPNNNFKVFIGQCF